MCVRLDTELFPKIDENVHDFSFARQNIVAFMLSVCGMSSFREIRSKCRKMYFDLETSTSTYRTGKVAMQMRNGI